MQFIYEKLINGVVSIRYGFLVQPNAINAQK